MEFRSENCSYGPEDFNISPNVRRDPFWDFGLGFLLAVYCLVALCRRGRPQPAGGEDNEGEDEDEEADAEAAHPGAHIPSVCGRPQRSRIAPARMRDENFDYARD